MFKRIKVKKRIAVVTTTAIQDKLGETISVEGFLSAYKYTMHA